MRFITSTRDESLHAWLASELPTAVALDVVSGYISASGIGLLEEPLRRLLEEGGRLRVVVGTQEDQLLRADALALLRLTEEYPDTASVLLMDDDTRLLHPKVYVLTRQDGTLAAYVGSGNLTAGGLLRNDEAGVLLDGPEDQGVCLSAQQMVAAYVGRRLERAALPELPSERTTRASRMWSVRMPAKSGSIFFADHLQPTLDRLEAKGNREGLLTGVPTGFADLDNLTGGLEPGQLIVVAGRPGIGKSVMALDIVRSAAMKHGLTTALFSLEMSHAEIMQRILSAEARVPHHHMRMGTMKEDDWTRLARRIQELAAAPLVLNDLAHLTVDELHAECQRLKVESDLRLVVVDYLQLIRPSKKTDRQVEVAEISRGLKLMAKDLGLPVVVASQVNRGPEQRADKRPQLFDLRESGAVEQDADVVILIHREDAYDRESIRAGEADFIVAKNRNGPTVTITVAFQGHYSRFVDMRPG
jgi:HKD family nuclease